MIFFDEVIRSVLFKKKVLATKPTLYCINCTECKNPEIWPFCLQRGVTYCLRSNVIRRIVERILRVSVSILLYVPKKINIPSAWQRWVWVRGLPLAAAEKITP